MSPSRQQVVIQALHRLLLALDAPYACQTPVHPHSQDREIPSCTLHWWDMEIWDPKSPEPGEMLTELQTCWAVCWVSAGGQGLLVCGEAITGYELMLFREEGKRPSPN